MSSQPRRGRAVRTTVVAVGLALGLTAVTGCGAGRPSGDQGPAAVVQTSGNAGPLTGIEVRPPFPLPAAELVSDDGARVRLDEALDRPVTVFFFGYTLCPDICTLVMADLAVAVSRLPDDVRADVRVALVSSDPARDTPAVLRAYLDRFDPGFTGFTGDLDTIVEVAETMGIAVDQGRRLPSGGYAVTHGAELVGYVGNKGVALWPQGVSVDDLATDLAALVAEARQGAASAAGGGEEG